MIPRVLLLFSLGIITFCQIEPGVQSFEFIGAGREMEPMELRQFPVGAESEEEATNSETTPQETTTNATPPQEHAEVDRMVVGGFQAVPHEFPFLVSLQMAGRKGSHFCGGSLITWTHVLTAAHCLTDTAPGNIRVVVGVHRINDYPNENALQVARFRLHESYDDYRIVNDIAIITLARPVPMHLRGSRTQLITMAKEPRVGESLIAAGWGKMDEPARGPLASVLMKANLNVVDPSRCSSVYRNAHSPSQVCVAHHRSTICNGDSGGPLFTKDRNGRFVLIGLTRFSREGYVCMRPV